MRHSEVSVSCANLAKQSRSAALLAAALSLVVAPPVASAAECPDPPTVSAAQLLEFKTMMMVVGLRCKSAGVMMADHNDELAAMRSTMFEEADRRVRRYIFAADRPAPVPIAPTVPVATATGASPKAKAPARSPFRARGKVPASGRARVPGKVLANAPGKVLAKAPVKALAKVATLPPKPAPRSRRDDPYEKYLTRVGTSYGMGDNSPGTCRKYDALVSFLADRTTPNNALTMAADRMIGHPILEKQAACPTSP